MSVAGHEIPLGKTTGDILLRSMIFDIIHPYCLSPEDMKVVNEADHREKTCGSKHLLIHKKELLAQACLIWPRTNFDQVFSPTTAHILHHFMASSWDSRLENQC